MKKQPKIALVLSGGGALGFAHLGVVEVLQKNNINIDLIVGTSMGAIIGGAVASGVSCEEIESVICRVKTRHLFDFHLPIKGMFSGKGAMRFLKQTIPDINQENTKIPFICNAVDLVADKEVVLKTGNLIDNIRASMSCPGIFNPVKKDGMLLVDGGVLNNMPHDIAHREGADIIIAVDVVTKSSLNDPVKNMVQCVIQSFLLSQKEVQNNKRKYYDVLVQPELGARKQYSFDCKVSKEIIELGRIAMQEKLPKVKELIEKHKVSETKVLSMKKVTTKSVKK